MKALIWIATLAAVAAALAVAIAGPGTRFGLWDYGTGLLIIRKAALPAMIAAGMAAIAFAAALVRARSLAPAALVGAVMAGIAAFVPVKMKQAVAANPFIHDVTTDFDNPPSIVIGALAPRKNPPDYRGGDPAPRSDMTVAEAQQTAFPDIGPIRTDMNLAEAAGAARAVIEDMGMAILDDGPSEAGWCIEAAHTSFWFGFVDDFVVRVSPDEETGGAIIDLRSKSRVGGSDLGANAARVRAFCEKFEAVAANAETAG